MKVLNIKNLSTLNLLFLYILLYLDIESTNSSLSPFTVQFLLLMLVSWKLISMSPCQQQLISETFNTKSFPSVLGMTKCFYSCYILKIREKLQESRIILLAIWKTNEADYTIWVLLAYRKYWSGSRRPNAFLKTLH